MNETRIESENTVPSSLAQVGIIIRYTLLDYVRSHRFFLLLAIVFGISVILTLVVGYTKLSIYNMWGQFAPFILLLAGIFLGGDAISGEFQNKTGYFSIPNPIRRSSIYIGKWLSAFTVSSIILGVFAMITIGNGLYYFSIVPSEFGLSVLFAWFYLAVVVGFVLFISSLFKSNTNSVFVSFVLLVGVFTLIQQISGVVNIEPWFILNYGAQIIGNILTVPYPPHETVGILAKTDIQVTTYYATVPEGLAIMGLYFIITIALGLLLFEKKEFT
jgi:ABC-2 type transport system permease protein